MRSISPSRFAVEKVFDERLMGRRSAPRLADEASIRLRLTLCGVGLAAAFAILGFRTAQLALDTPAPTFQQDAGAEVDGPVRLEDRNGRSLAVTLRGVGLAIDGAEVFDVEEAVAGLAWLFPDIDAQRVTEKLEARERVTIERLISEKDRDAVMSLGLPGIAFPESEQRAYPQGRLFSHVVGYQIPGRGGVTGLEATMTANDLVGVHRTTLDAAAQTILVGELVRAYEKFEAKAAWGVLINAKTGAVAAMASLPDFDPNKPGASAPAARRNRVVSDTYELGSAFKALTVAMALEAGLADLDTPVDVTSPLRVGEWAIEDYTLKGPVMSVEELLAVSSNIGAAQLALLLGAESFTHSLEKFGLTDRLITALPESRQPLLPEVWGPAEIATASYGHGIAVTPLHLARSFAALVNGGELITPRFLESDLIEARQVLSKETSSAMRQALRTVVTEGTGGKAEAPGFYVIGKTATADKPKNGSYDEDGPLLSSFIGAFPGYDPEWVLLISLDEPNGTADTYGFATAGWTAAPVFRRTVERLAPVLGVMPTSEDVAADGFLTVWDGEARRRRARADAAFESEAR